MFNRVLVATDFSAHADTMLECIGQIPGLQEILLVHVINETLPETSNSLLGFPQPSPRDQVLTSLGKKRQFLEKVTGVQVSQRIIEATDGDIAGAIVRLAHVDRRPPQ